MAFKAVKTEHAGAKRGGVGYYGRKAEAKRACKKARRAADKAACKEG